MKVALVQDWLIVNGGAEKVFKEIAGIFPNADVFALVDYLSEEDREELINGRKIITSFIQKLPNARYSYRSYLPLFPLAIESMDFSSYDLIISSSYAVAKGLKKHEKQVHICYCHSPVRYAWDLQDEYLEKMGGIKKLIARFILSYIRKWDLKTASRPNVFIANSKYIADRIRRTYNRESIVLYPPVDTSAFTGVEQKENYYFTSARLVPYKKTDLIVEAFNALPHLKLKVSGDGPELEYLKSIAGKNIEFTGFLERADLVTHMQNAKAFILAANEDFGITSVEAQSCFTPVIALNKGGYKETVVNEKTGIFFNEQTSESIKNAVERFESIGNRWNPEEFTINVNKFSIARFKDGFNKIVAEHDRNNP